MDRDTQYNDINYTNDTIKINVSCSGYSDKYANEPYIFKRTVVSQYALSSLTASFDILCIFLSLSGCTIKPTNEHFPYSEPL